MYSNLTKHRKNIAVLALLIAIVMVSLSGRLGYLMLFCSEHYSAMAEDLHQRERTIKAARGRIIDANGVVIADNRTVCTISVIYNQVKDREQVINGSELESGRAARCLFTQQGNVGHGPECHWSVQDRQQSIPAQAFTVILHDGTFCLRPQTAQLWLNQAKVTATSDLIQLRQGDEIQIGRLMVRVHLNRGDIPHYDEEMATPETIVTNRDMLTDSRLQPGP